MSDPDRGGPYTNIYSSRKELFLGGSWRKFPKPWFMSIVFKDGYRNYKCGGTLLNKNWMVTAAHCFCSDHSKYFKCKRKGTLLTPTGYKLKHDVKIHLNIHPGAGRVERRIAKLVIHPKYKLNGIRSL